jgi:hypothetical protein
MSAKPLRKPSADAWPPHKNPVVVCDDMTMFNEQKFLSALRRRFPGRGGPRDALRVLGFDANLNELPKAKAPPVDDMVRFIGKLLKERRRIALDATTGDYADIPTELAKFRDELPTHLPPEIYERWKKRFVDLIGRTAELVKAVNAAINERANGASDQPPPFEGKPQRGGEPLAADSGKPWSRVGVIDDAGCVSGGRPAPVRRSSAAASSRIGTV